MKPKKHGFLRGENMENKKTLRDRMKGENRPDFSKYQNHDQVVTAKLNVISKAWENVRQAEEDVEPMEKIRELRKIAVDQLNNWRKYITLSERHFDHDLTIKKAEVIAVTMAQTKPENRDELFSWFFKLCDRVNNGRTINSGRVINVGRFNSLNDYVHFCNALYEDGETLVEEYPILDSVLKELGL
jgi:hypothetical protein